MNIYEYKNRTIIVFDDYSRASYSKKRYGILLDKVVNQSINQKEKIYNPYDINNDNTVTLYYYEQKTNKVINFIIDADDLQKVKNYYWHTNVNGYITSNTKGKKIYLHHLILNYKHINDFCVDHIYRNILNNTKVNLRIATLHENAWNRAKNKMTGIHKKDGKYRVTCSRILCQDVMCDTLEEAMIIREKFVKQLEKYLLNKKVQRLCESSKL